MISFTGMLNIWLGISDRPIPLTGTNISLPIYRYRYIGIGISVSVRKIIRYHIVIGIDNYKTQILVSVSVLVNMYQSSC